MSVALVGTVSTAGPGNLTTGTLDTTGATLLVIYLGYYTLGSAPSISDSKSNTWTALTLSDTTVSGAGKLYYAQNPTVGTGHTFSVSTSVANVIIAAAFSGTLTSSVFDSEGPGYVGNSADAQSFPGPMTTGADEELVVTGLSWELDGGSPTVPVINESYSITDYIPFVNTVNFGGTFAWRTFGSAGTVTDPTWNYGNSPGMSGRNVSSIAGFFASASGVQPIVFVIT